MGTGRYVLYKESHFVGFQIWDDGSCILRPTCRKHVGSIYDWEPSLLEPCTAVFEMVSTDMAGHTCDGDCLGGGLESVMIERALGGEHVMTVPVSSTQPDSLLDIVRRNASSKWACSYFAVQCLANGALLSPHLSWKEAGCPDTIQIIMAPLTMSLTKQLFHAIGDAEPARVLEVLEQGQDPNCTQQGKSALCAAISSGEPANAEVVQMLLDGGADPNGQSGGLAVLSHAVLGNHYPIVFLLIKKGANVHYQNPMGLTALHEVVLTPHFESAKVLLDCGADPTIQDSDGDTPFTLCNECFKMNALLMDAIWDKLTWADMLAKFVEALQDLVPVPHLFAMHATCRRLQKQRVYSCWKDARGGSSAMAPFRTACLDVVDGSTSEGALKRRADQQRNAHSRGMEMGCLGLNNSPGPFEFVIGCAVQRPPAPGTSLVTVLLVGGHWVLLQFAVSLDKLEATLWELALLCGEWGLELCKDRTIRQLLPASCGAILLGHLGRLLDITFGSDETIENWHPWFASLSLGYMVPKSSGAAELLRFPGEQGPMGERGERTRQSDLCYRNPRDLGGNCSTSDGMAMGEAYEHSHVFDVAGGAAAQSAEMGGDETSSFAVPPPIHQVHLEVTHRRAQALRQRWGSASTPRAEMDAQALHRKGFTAEEAEHYLASRREAVARRGFMQEWSTSMVPIIEPKIGQMLGTDRGVRIPLPPLDFFAQPTPTLTWLSSINHHRRDERISFQEEGHKYFVDGKVVDASVTSLLSAFSPVTWLPNIASIVRPFVLSALCDFCLRFIISCEVFDADAAIAAMKAGPYWPRPQYRMPDGRLMSDAEIKELWRRNGEEAAAEGTRMHLQCEIILNGGVVHGNWPEMHLLKMFLQEREKLIAYRTEWTIWASAENLAGSIDFVARDIDGHLVLFDWKRTKNLPHKYENQWSYMCPPLQHLPNSTGIKYRLQLNCYRWILEKYYQQCVSHMFIACLHPEHQHPWVDEVPVMEWEVEVIMQSKRGQCCPLEDVDDEPCAADVCGGGPFDEEAMEGSDVQRLVLFKKLRGYDLN